MILRRIASGEVWGMSSDDRVITLRRNRIIGLVACVACILLGTIVLVAAIRPIVRPMGIFLAAFLIVPGVWIIPLMLRPWRLDTHGVLLGRRRVMEWDQVTRVVIDDIRPQGAGRGPARVAITLLGADTRVYLWLYSFHDARQVQSRLERSLVSDVPGRELLRRISDAWSEVR